MGGAKQADPQGSVGAPSVDLQADARLLPVAALGWAAAWLAPVIGIRGCLILAGASALVGGTCLSLAWRRRDGSTAELTVDEHAPRLLPLTAAALLVCSAIAAVAGLRSATAESSIVDELARERAVVTATLRITGDPRLSTAGTGPPIVLVPAVVALVTGRGQTVRAAAPVLAMGYEDAWRDLIPSARVQATGRLGPSDRVGREIAVFVAAGPPQVVTAATLLQRVAARLRLGLRTAVAGLPPDPRGLVPGLVVGDDSQMPPDLDDDFKTAGLTHLTAVSGTNVAIVLVFVLGVGRWIGARGIWLRLVALLGLAGFVVLARPDPSVLRAAVMGVIAVIGARHPQRRPLAALTVAIVALLLLDPWLGRSYGFALSVLATAAIVVWVPSWRESLARWLPTWLAEALAVPLAAQLACAPVIVLLSQQVSIVAVLANLLAAPAVGPATIAAVVVTAVAPASAPFAAALAWLPGLPAAWIAAVARHSAHLPHATIAWFGGIGGAVGLAVATLLAVAALRRVVHRPSAALLSVLVVLAVVAAVRLVRPPWPSDGWAFVACDVGQGDGLVLAAGDGAAVVVDAGPDPALIDACLDRLGIVQLPLVVLTHSDADHIGGLPGALRGRSVGAVAVAPRAWVPAKLPELEATVARTPARLVQLAAGTSVTYGALTLDVLWPPTDGVIPVGVGESLQNDACIVVRASWAGGLRVLLTGDLPPAGQRALLATGADLQADVLKVPHHGSRFQDPAFLAATDASVAIVSVGADNTYGHPAEQTLGDLAADGMTIERTDVDGAVAISGSASRPAVSTAHGGRLGLGLGFGGVLAFRRWAGPLMEQRSGPGAKAAPSG